MSYTFQFWNDRFYQDYYPVDQQLLNRLFSARNPQVDLPGGSYHIAHFDNVEHGYAVQVNGATGFERSVRIKPPFAVPGAQKVSSVLPNQILFQYNDNGWTDYGPREQRELWAIVNSAPTPSEVLLPVEGRPPYWICGLDQLKASGAGTGVFEGAHQVNAKTHVRRDVRVIDKTVARAAVAFAGAGRGRHGLQRHAPAVPAAVAAAAAQGRPARGYVLQPALAPAPAGFPRRFSLRDVVFKAAHGPGGSSSSSSAAHPSHAHQVFDPAAAEMLLEAWRREPRSHEVCLPSGHVVKNLARLEENGAIIESSRGEKMHVQCSINLPPAGSLTLPRDLDTEVNESISRHGRNLSVLEVKDLLDQAAATEDCECIICRGELTTDTVGAGSNPSLAAPGAGSPAANPDFGETDVFQLDCGHTYHRDCLEHWFKQKRRCPQCMRNYGKIFGSQPSVGTMEWGVEQFSLPGLHLRETIVVAFDFPPGVDRSQQSYDRRRAKCYLPGNFQGAILLELYKVAFRRCVMFGMGTSMTLGTYRPTFNIHIKTNSRKADDTHGFPDPEYYFRSLEELRINGVFISDLPCGPPA